MKKYLPLLLVEAYLVITLLLFFIGPINFNIHNKFFFISLIFLYHAFFIFGYWISIACGKKFEDSCIRHFSSRLYYVSLFLGCLGVLITFNNMMPSFSANPYDIILKIARGLMEPGLVYSERMAAIDSGEVFGSRFLNTFSILFAFFKLFFVFLFVYYWRELDALKKFLAVLYSLFFISIGVASGTNSFVFIFFFFLSASVLVVLYNRNYKHLKKLIVFLGGLFLIPVASFGYIMSQRGGALENIEMVSPLGDITIYVQYLNTDPSSLLNFFYLSYVWLVFYLVHGYYGFSLILNLEHYWTFGFGNSAFLQRQFLMLTDIDVSHLTFQNRIDQYWSETGVWHTFYGQFANDFGFVGLTGLMFILGYLLGKTWSSVIYSNSFYGAALMPIYALMFIFFPANNQVFGFITTLSYFIFINTFWLLEKKKITA